MTKEIKTKKIEDKKKSCVVSSRAGAHQAARQENVFSTLGREIQMVWLYYS